MPQPRRVPDKETMTKWWVDEDLSRQEIVDRIWEQTHEKVTVQAISVAVRRYGLPAKRNRWSTQLPWTVRTEHLGVKEARLLRLAGRRQAGLKNQPDDDLWLDGWLQELEQNGRPVVAYYPETEEGFTYHARVPEDGDGEFDLIRRPEVQTLLNQRENGVA